MTRRLPALLALLTLPLALAACGERSEPTATGTQDVSVMLDFFPNADHAGFYAAQADGEFDRAGLRIDLRTPSDPSAPLKLLAAGKVDVAISYEPELLLARDRGARLVSIGALVQKPLTSIMAVGRRLRSPAQLEGHTVGTAGIPYQSAYLKTILAARGANPDRVREVNVGFNLVPAMLSKRVFATLGAFWNYEGVQLRRRRKQVTIIPVDRAGVPTYNELILVVREQDARRRGPLLRRLMQALTRGQQALRKDPEPALRALLKANPDLDEGHQRAVVKATLPVFFPEDPAKPFGWQEPREWAAYGRWMLRNRLVTQLPSPRAMTNEFLPGQGV